MLMTLRETIREASSQHSPRDPYFQGMSAVSSCLVTAPMSTTISHSPELQNVGANSFSVFFRESLDKLSQRGQLLSEEGHGAGKEGRLCSQLLTNYQNLLRMTKEKLRSCQLALQEHEALEEALQSMWSWVRDAQDKLASADSTVGGRDTLEKRLLQIQVPGPGLDADSFRRLTSLESPVFGLGPRHAVSL